MDGKNQHTFAIMEEQNGIPYNLPSPSDASLPATDSNLLNSSTYLCDYSFPLDTYPIRCLVPRTTVTSLSAFKDTRYKTHPVCVNPGVPF